jgi:hypothetical protein
MRGRPWDQMLLRFLQFLLSFPCWVLKGGPFVLCLFATVTSFVNTAVTQFFFPLTATANCNCNTPLPWNTCAVTSLSLCYSYLQLVLDGGWGGVWDVKFSVDCLLLGFFSSNWVLRAHSSSISLTS